MTPTLMLEPHAVLRLRWNGSIPTESQLKAVRAIPGARQVDGGYEWGWWGETAQRLGQMLRVQLDGFSGLTLNGYPHFHHPDNVFGPSGWTWVSPERAQAVEWRSKTSPRPHQLDFKAWRRGGGRDGLYHPACLAEVALGGGKTLSAIEEKLELVVHRPRARTLVLVRSSLIETTWATQLALHAPDLPFTLLNGPRTSRLTQLETTWGRPYPMVYVHSYEDLPGLVRADGKPTSMGKWLASLEWDMIVIDETSQFRTAGAQRTGRLTGYQARPLTAPYRLGLSGLPMIKSAFDLYPILRWLGAPVGNKGQFAELFMVQNPRTGEISLGDPARLLSLLECWRFQVPKSAVLAIPRTWHYERIPMKPWQRERYRRLQRELRGDDPEELASSELERLLRLAQVTAGFDEDGRYRADNAKLEHLVAKTLPVIGEEQAIIWTCFRQEALGVRDGLLATGRSAVAFTGAQSDRDNADAYRRFIGDRDQYFVPTLAKGSLGLNLPMAQTMVYVTRDFNTEQVVQSLERNARLDTVHATLNVVVLEAEHSIDQKVTQVVGDDVREASRLTTADVKEILGL